MKICAIIAAAGKGKRMGKDYNKQYIFLRDKPIIAHTIEIFENTDLIDEIIPVVAGDEVDWVRENIVRRYNYEKVTEITEGGAERQDSVYNGLRAVSDDCDMVLVHDGARPFVTCDIIKRGIDTAKNAGACIVAVRVKDTIKIVNKNMEVDHTPNRDTLWAAQTPQFFRYELLLEAYEQLYEKPGAGKEPGAGEKPGANRGLRADRKSGTGKEPRADDIKATDDAVLVEKLGYTVKVIEGSYENIKITTPEDLILGEGILKKRENTKK